MQRRQLYLAAAAIVTLSSASGAAGAYVEQQLHKGNSSNIVSVLKPQTKATLTSQDATLSIPSIVNNVAPAVVDITTQSSSYSFLGGPVTQQGAGTGMILTSNGYILTNNHVLPIGGGTMTVTTQAGKQYSARVITANTTEDLALIKINGNNLPTITLGNSSQEVVGNSVVAIGNALGQYQNTVVSGIISGLNRSVTASDENEANGGESLSGLLQTDAAINPGNSGGPLIDVATGSVIGINTAISSDAQDIGFAIPINEAKSFIAPYVTIASV